MESPNRAAGGKAKAQKIRAAYNANPRHCEFCGNPILLHDGQKLADVRAKKFCNSSCAASQNGALYPKRKAAAGRTAECNRCGAAFLLSRSRDGKSFTQRKFCDNCGPIARLESRGLANFIGERTKAELFQARSGWQSARSGIRAHAALMFSQSGKPLACAVCGYSTVVEICHIKAVSSFPDDALISEINGSVNLVALCPNHHWEFDHNLITL